MNEVKCTPIVGKFLDPADKKALAKEQKQAQIKMKREKTARHREKVLTKIFLVICDGLLIYMTMNNLIDQAFGILFVAGLSILFGYQLK